MRNIRFRLLLVVLSLVVNVTPLRVQADEYDESQSHPLRVVGYVTHPLGVLLEWTLARPFHALVSGSKGLEYIFGHRPHPPLLPETIAHDYGAPKRVPLKPAVAPVKVGPPEPVAERVTIRVQEVPVERTVTVVKEVPQAVEVERVLFPDIAFQFNSTELTDLGKGKAYLAAQKLKEKAGIVVVVEGHADAKGAPEYNQRLGQRRAERVIKELAELGVDPARMSAVSLGQTKPLIEQDTDWARAVNRRVEFGVKGQ